MPKHLPIEYPGFRHHAEELSAYTEFTGIFIIALVNQEIVRFEPEDCDNFEQWLRNHKVRDIRS